MLSSVIMKWTERKAFKLRETIRIWGPHRFHRGQLPVTIRCLQIPLTRPCIASSQVLGVQLQRQTHGIHGIHGIHALFDRIGRFKV